MAEMRSLMIKYIVVYTNRTRPKQHELRQGRQSNQRYCGGRSTEGDPEATHDVMSQPSYNDTEMWDNDKN